MRSFPDSGAKWPVSTGGATEPVWTPDGKNLYFRSSGHLMAVDIETEPRFSASRPTTVFEDRFEAWVGVPYVSNYDFSPDGKRLLMSAPAAQTEYRTVHIVLNWFQELERLVPTS